MEFIPAAFRKPYLHLGESVCHRLGDRSDEHVISEHILAAEFRVICFLSCRPVIVQRTAESDTFVISLTCHCVDVWRHVITLTYCLADDIGVFLGEYPRLLVEGSALRAVSTHHRAETAILKPSCVHFWVNRITEMSSDIMAPISVEYI